MRMNRKYKPELVASKDMTRTQLTAPYYDAEGKHIMATDGHRLIVLPVETDPGDHSGHIPPVALKEARAIAKKANGEIDIRANGACEVPAGATYPRPDLGTFPPIDQVIPKAKRGDDGTITIGLNARYLYELAQALGASNCEISLTVETADQLNPLRVDTLPGSGAFAVLMPCRIDMPKSKKKRV